MNPINIAKKTIDIAYSGINIGCSIRYLKDYAKYKKVITRNARFKDLHKGKTCYILGNGPSIKQLDTSLLKGKYIFTVNAMTNTELFDKLHPQYHCVIDRFVYQRIKDQLVDKVATCDTDFFFHRSIYEDCKLFDNAFFTYNTIIPIGTKMKVDLTKNANIFINVVPYAIMIAMYMGFEKIVLLGCDFSFFASRKDVHFYETGMGVERKESLYEDLQGSAIAWQQYNTVYQYAQVHGTTIVNATPNSLLDVFPQVNLTECK